MEFAGAAALLTHTVENVEGSLHAGGEKKRRRLGPQRATGTQHLDSRLDL